MRASGREVKERLNGEIKEKEAETERNAKKIVFEKHARLEEKGSIQHVCWYACMRRGFALPPNCLCGVLDCT